MQYSWSRTCFLTSLPEFTRWIILWAAWEIYKPQCSHLPNGSMIIKLNNAWKALRRSLAWHRIKQSILLWLLRKSDEGQKVTQMWSDTGKVHLRFLRPARWTQRHKTFITQEGNFLLVFVSLGVNLGQLWHVAWKKPSLYLNALSRWS